MSSQASSIYPQAQPFKEGELETFMSRPLVAKLCTHNPDGTIHIAPLWFDYVDGEVVFGTQDITQKVKNIRRDDRVTVLVDDADQPLQGVIIYGTAKLQYDEVIPTRVALFSKYMDEQRASSLAAQLASTWEPVIVRVTPERVITYHYGHGFGISQSDGGKTEQNVF